MGYGGYNERVSKSVLNRKCKDEFIRPWVIIRWAWRGAENAASQRIDAKLLYVQSLYFDEDKAVKMKGAARVY